MIHLDKCAFCGGNLLEKKVSEIVKGGGDTASLTSEENALHYHYLW